MSEIAFLGDIAFNGLITSLPEANNERFKLISGVLKNTGLVFANLEMPVMVSDESNETKKKSSTPVKRLQLTLLNY